MAKSISEAQVDFAEIDPTHLATINKNIQNNLTEQPNQMDCSVMESDLFENVTEVYDFILTNPPYIDPEIDRAETSVKMHEPRLALYGGVQGMECIQRIIEQASDHLTENGQLWIEHEPEQTEAIATLSQENNFVAIINNDQYNTPRYSVLTRSVAE